MTRELGETELDALMSRLADGDRSAFEPLFRALHPRALGLARRKLPKSQRTDADEVAQRALVKLFANAGSFARGKPLLPWFYALVANELREARRVARREALRFAGSPEDETAQDAAVSPEELLIEQELARALDLAIDSLDAPAAQAIHALLGRGPPPGIEPATLRKRVSRAYTRLRLLLLGKHDAR